MTRRTVAVMAGKATGTLSRITRRGGGTTLPGESARAIDPEKEGESPDHAARKRKGAPQRGRPPRGRDRPRPAPQAALVRPRRREDRVQDTPARRRRAHLSL